MRSAHRHLSRAFFLVCGLVSVALGIAGAFLPLLPTTPFMLLAAGCFARSSPRFHAWLTNHPKFGPMLRDWNERGAIPRKAKLIALGGIAISMVSVWTKSPYLWSQLSATAVLVGALVFIFTRPDA